MLNTAQLRPQLNHVETVCQIHMTIEWPDIVTLVLVALPNVSISNKYFIFADKWNNHLEYIQFIFNLNHIKSATNRFIIHVDDTPHPAETHGLEHKFGHLSLNIFLTRYKLQMTKPWD